MSENDYLMEIRVTRSLRKRLNSTDDELPTQKKTPLKVLNTIVEDERKGTRSPKINNRRMSLAEETNASTTPVAKTPGRRITRRISLSESLDILPEPSPVRRTRRTSISSEDVPITPSKNTSKRLSVLTKQILAEEEEEYPSSATSITSNDNRRITRSTSKSPNVSPPTVKISLKSLQTDIIFKRSSSTSPQTQKLLIRSSSESPKLNTPISAKKRTDNTRYITLKSKSPELNGEKGKVKISPSVVLVKNLYQKTSPKKIIKSPVSNDGQDKVIETVESVETPVVNQKNAIMESVNVTPKSSNTLLKESSKSPDKNTIVTFNKSLEKVNTSLKENLETSSKSPSIEIKEGNFPYTIRPKRRAVQLLSVSSESDDFPILLVSEKEEVTTSTESDKISEDCQNRPTEDIETISINDETALEPINVGNKTNSEKEIITHIYTSPVNEEIERAKKQSLTKNINNEDSEADISDKTNKVPEKDTLNRISIASNTSKENVSTSSSEPPIIFEDNSEINAEKSDDNDTVVINTLQAMEQSSESLQEKESAEEVENVELNSANDLQNTSQVSNAEVENNEENAVHVEEPIPDLCNDTNISNKEILNKDPVTESSKISSNCDQSNDENEFPKFWSNAVVVSTLNSSKSNFIDGFALDKNEKPPEKVLITSTKKKVKRIQHMKSDSEIDSDEPETERNRNEFIESEADEYDDDVESISSEERQYLEDNEVPVHGESIGSEDTEEDVQSIEESEELNSFVVSDEDYEKLSVNSDEDTDKNKKRILSRPTESSEEDENVNTSQGIEKNSKQYEKKQTDDIDVTMANIEGNISSEKEEKKKVKKRSLAKSIENEDNNDNDADNSVKTGKVIKKGTTTTESNTSTQNVTLSSEDNFVDINYSSKNEEFQSCDNQSLETVIKKRSSLESKKITTPNVKMIANDSKITKRKRKSQTMETTNQMKKNHDQSIDDESLHMSSLFDKDKERENAKIYTSSSDSDNSEVQSCSKINKIVLSNNSQGNVVENSTGDSDSSDNAGQKIINQTKSSKSLEKHTRKKRNERSLSDNSSLNLKMLYSDSSDNEGKKIINQTKSSKSLEKHTTKKRNERSLSDNSSLNLKMLYSDSSDNGEKEEQSSSKMAVSSSQKTSNETFTMSSESNSSSSEKEGKDENDLNNSIKSTKLKPFSIKDVHSTPLRLDTKKKIKNISNTEKHSSFKESILSKEEELNSDQILENTFSKSFSDKCHPPLNFSNAESVNTSRKRKNKKSSSTIADANDATKSTNDSNDDMLDKVEAQEMEKIKNSQKKQGLKKKEHDKDGLIQKEKSKNKYRKDEGKIAKGNDNTSDLIKSKTADSTKKRRLPEEFLQSIATESDKNETTLEKKLKKKSKHAEKKAKNRKDFLGFDDDETSAFAAHVEKRKQILKSIEDVGNLITSREKKLKRKRTKTVSLLEEAKTILPKSVPTAAGDFNKVSKITNNKFESPDGSNNTLQFIESDIPPVTPNKKKLKIISYVPSGIIEEEPITPKSQKIINGFKETDLTPKPIGFKVKSILSHEKKLKRKRTKAVSLLEEAKTILPKSVPTAAGDFKVSKITNNIFESPDGSNNTLQFIESDISPVTPKKKKLKIISYVRSGIIEEEPITPKSQKIINGFKETDLTPKPIGFKVKSILSHVDTPPSTVEKRKKTKRKLIIDEPTTVLPKRVWTSAGEFTVTNTANIQLNSPASTEFSVTPLEIKKSKKGFTNFASTSSNTALQFKHDSIYNDKIRRESSKDLLRRKIKQRINKKM